MPMYMDIHEIRGATAEAVAKAHRADVETQEKYGVEYHKYWFNESCGKIFCLCSAPSRRGGGHGASRSAWPGRREDHRGRARDCRGFLGEMRGEQCGRRHRSRRRGEPSATRDPDRSVHRTSSARRSSRSALGTTRRWPFFRSMTQIVRDALRALAGREIKHTGDGIMSSVLLGCGGGPLRATRIHRALAQHEQEKKGIPIKVRIGAARGEPVEDHLDLFGSTGSARRAALLARRSRSRARYRTWSPSCASARA